MSLFRNRENEDPTATALFERRMERMGRPEEWRLEQVGAIPSELRAVHRSGDSIRIVMGYYGTGISFLTKAQADALDEGARALVKALRDSEAHALNAEALAKYADKGGE